MTDLISLIKKYINLRLQILETVEVVIVESVNLSTWKCDVRPKPKLNIVGNAVDAPIVMNVPMAAPKAGDSVILMPVAVGDVCVCVFSKYALDNLLIDKETNTIKIPRTFDLNDCILIGGLFTELDTVPTIVEGEIIIHHHSGTQIKFTNDGKIYITG